MPKPDYIHNKLRIIMDTAANLFPKYKIIIAVTASKGTDRPKIHSASNFTGDLSKLLRTLASDLEETDNSPRVREFYEQGE